MTMVLKWGLQSEPFAAVNSLLLDSAAAAKL